jgi:hypothetical protein
LLPPVGWVQFTRRLRHLQISTTFATRPATGRKITLSTGCVRLGILSSRTAGMPDLVCGRETVLRFDPARGSYQ